MQKPKPPDMNESLLVVQKFLEENQPAVKELTRIANRSSEQVVQEGFRVSPTVFAHDLKILPHLDPAVAAAVGKVAQLSGDVADFARQNTANRALVALLEDMENGASTCKALRALLPPLSAPPCPHKTWRCCAAARPCSRP